MNMKSGSAMTPVDPDTAALVRKKLSYARLAGLDPVWMLNRAGLLDHPAKRRTNNSALIRAVAEELAAATPLQLGRGIVPDTAADMKRCMLDALHRMAQREEM